uniref:Uncharacterized protein n=1 Tax=Solanum tuberosum TaxID=4113 RepID=M1D5S6_SOLTU
MTISSYLLVFHLHEQESNFSYAKFVSSIQFAFGNTSRNFVYLQAVVSKKS